MSKVTGVLVLFALISFAFAGKPKCPENEEEYTCLPKCPRTCENRGHSIAGIISGKPKCDCKAGYLRYKGKCIPECQCPKPVKCGPNEAYTFESACTTTCNNYKTPHLCNVFKFGCHCLPGFIRDTISKKCVRPCDCPKKPCKCGPNEVLVKCAPKCPETCENLGQPRCLGLKCGKPVCVCKKGFVRLGKLCVPKTSCPKKCKKNEVFTKICNPCQPSCKNPKRKPCSPKCKEGCCACCKGFIRETDDQNSPCIPINKCPKPCKENEVPVLCENPCQPSCCNPKRPPCYPKHCIPGFHCKPGYIRKTDDPDSPCIKIKDCPNTPKKHDDDDDDDDDDH